VEAAIAVLRRFYRLVFLDTGNDVAAEHWNTAIRLVDHVVIPCTGNEDTSKAAGALLDLLSNHPDEHYRELAARATIIVTAESSDKAEAERVQRTGAAFSAALEHTQAEVVTIPFDEALRTGALQFDLMRARTQRAWTAATAAILRALTE
jgi:hypothetical protein